MITILQVLGITFLLAYAVYWRRGQTRRRAATWESIVARLRSNSEFGFDQVAEKYLYAEGINATTEDIWPRIDGANGLWAMYTNAGVLMELADYTAAHASNIPEELIENLRSDAFQVRTAVLMALVKYAFSHSRVASSVNAHRAASAYSGMLAHITTMFQDHSALFFPRFLEAM
ncbi:hypothetical protein [Paracidobacterium acidisoli]|uniref:Uncharacterized protein n=1 Tax=Paracidobacterium acidisoli TaxID=2303751 RepID=A0A372IJB3_9BACT|nr:hypothetical protein [Paracidobacterium acidisoli]MBT9333364.1 hypothetical protein [Paracidobacterium acidisoli]